MVFDEVFGPFLSIWSKITYIHYCSYTLL